MQLDIKLIKTYEMFCEESALASVACWKKRNYQMMFTKMLGFDFDMDAAIQDNNMGNHILCGYSIQDLKQMMEYYHGIRVELHTLQNEENLSEIILQELKKEMPVGIFIFYANIVSTFLLIIGHEANEFYYYDVHENDTSVKSISMSIIDAYAKEKDIIKYYTYRIVGEEMKNISFDTFAEYVNKSDYIKNKDTLKNMLKMADFIEHRLDLEKETLGEDALKSPLFPSFVNLIRARRLLSDVLDYIYTIDHSQHILYCKETLLNIAGGWKEQWLMIYKIYLSKMWKDEGNYKANLRCVAEELRKIAQKEYNFFSNVYQNQSLESNEFIKYTKKEMLVSSMLFDIDLSQYYNNKAFLCNNDNKKRADISGFSEYFILDNNEITLKSYNLTLKMKLCSLENDNISCMGQDIALDSVVCRKMLIIVLAEWGKCNTNMRLCTRYNEQINLELEVDDWYEYRLKDETVWSGKAITVNRTTENRGLYGYLYTFKDKIDIIRIKLPQKNNLHIFKIYTIE